jgi:hypothetical protein
VEIRIGIVNSPRELSFESSQSAADIAKAVADALTTGSAFISLSDSKGTSYLVPTTALAYVEIGSEETRRVGFLA